MCQFACYCLDLRSASLTPFLQRAAGMNETQLQVYIIILFTQVMLHALTIEKL